MKSVYEYQLEREQARIPQQSTAQPINPMLEFEKKVLYQEMEMLFMKTLLTVRNPEEIQKNVIKMNALGERYLSLGGRGDKHDGK